jgi:hypothetical protein
MRYGKGYILGVLRLALSPLRQAQGPADSLRMTGLESNLTRP